MRYQQEIRNKQSNGGVRQGCLATLASFVANRDFNGKGRTEESSIETSNSPSNNTYRSSSITCSRTSLPGRTASSGSVANGSSVIFSRSTKLGASVLT
jgi:hypothetical protein